MTMTLGATTSAAPRSARVVTVLRSSTVVPRSTTRTAWVGGVVIAVMGIAALVQFAEWEDWIALIAGVLVIISPWVLGFAAVQYAMATCVILGLIVALASVSEIWMVHHPAMTAR